MSNMVPDEQLPTLTMHGHEEEEKQACLYALQLCTLSILPMTLKAAVELGILDHLLQVGTPISAKEIASGLGISNPDPHLMLDHVLRLLSSHNVVTCSPGIDPSTGASMQVYSPSPVCKHLAMNDYHGFNTIGPLALLVHDPASVKAMFCLKEAVERGGAPFELYHGEPSYPFIGRDVRYRDVFYKAMSSHSAIAMTDILENYQGFQGLRTLMDVGGLGACLSMIMSKHPHIHGINFDLPHIVSGADSTLPGIEHVGGDMFESVPQGDAIFLKCILHDWSDENCIKLLKNCWKALPCNGKVIVAELILPQEPESDQKARYGFQMDLCMFSFTPNGKERTEKEFDSLREEAGFARLNVACRASSICIMEMEK